MSIYQSCLLPKQDMNIINKVKSSIGVTDMSKVHNFFKEHMTSIYKVHIATG